MKKGLLLFLIFYCYPKAIQSQIIFPESFVVLLDSSTNFKGSFTPEVKIQTQKLLLIEIASQTDLVFRIKNNSLVVAQKFELTAFGEERALESGFFFIKWKANKEKRWMSEYYSELQWAEGLGLKYKTAVGFNIRHAFFRMAKRGLFAGVGVFYEHEKWNYDGVKEELLPIDRSPIPTNYLKTNWYINYKKWVADKFYLDISGYYQARFDELLKNPRLALSSEFSWQFQSHLQLITKYQPIYDFRPIVPINKWFHQFIITFSLTF